MNIYLGKKDKRRYVDYSCKWKENVCFKGVFRGYMVF